jgi:DNA-binding transcriptional ArsR family regulator
MTCEVSRTVAADCCTELFGTEFLQAMCEPSRAAILREMLLKGRADISTLAKDMPLDRSVISRHLRVLEEVGVVRSEKEGRHTYYEIDGPALIKQLERFTELVRMIQPVCCP